MRKIVFPQSKINFTIIFCLVSLFFLLANNRAYPQDGSLQLLIINVTNLITNSKNPSLSHTEEMNDFIGDILQEVYGNTKAYGLTIYPTPSKVDNTMLEQDIRLLNKAYSETKSDKIHVNIVLRCYEDVNEWRRTGEYPQDALLLFDQAAQTVKAIVNDFKQHFPQGKVVGFAINVGSKVLLRSIQYGINDFNAVVLYESPKDEINNLKSAISKLPNTNFWALYKLENHPEFPVVADSKSIKEIVSKW